MIGHGFKKDIAIQIINGVEKLIRDDYIKERDPSGKETASNA